MWVFYLECRDSRLTLREGETVLGRGEDCHFPLNDPSASRRHAVIRRTGHRLVLSDLGSSNGSFVNGVRVQQDQPIEVDDRILIGETQLLVRAVHLDSGTEGRFSIEPVPPSQTTALGIEILEQRTERPQGEVSTEPQFSSIDVLESLVQSPHSAEEPRALAIMIQSSVERLLTTVKRRGLVLSAPNQSRLLAIVDKVVLWFPDGAMDSWARSVRSQLGRPSGG